MKRLLRLLTVILAISFLVACAKTPDATVAPEAPSAAGDEAAAPTEAPVVATDAPVEPTAVPLSAADQWAKDNGIGIYTPDTEDWDAIEAAAKLEGSVVVYSNSSRIANIADAWAALYPDIEFIPFDLGSDAVVTKIREEQEAGAFTGDVGMASGSYFAVEFVPKQYLWSYYPPELTDVLPEANRTPLVTHSLETYGWLYNSQLNDSCPISNWWEPTQPEWKGKIAINKDPITSGSDMGMLTTAAHQTDELAASYLEVYGKDWTTDSQYGDDTPDVGWLWLKKLTQNQMISGGDDAWSVMGSPDIKENIIGLFWYSKYRKVIDGEAFFEPCVGMDPVVGIQKHNYLAILNQAPHPNAAKLYIKFALSQEGIVPWNQVGQVSGRTDIEPAEEAIPFLDLPVWQLDEDFTYANVAQYHDFYSYILLTP